MQASIVLGKILLLQCKVIVDGPLRLMGDPDPFASHSASVTLIRKMGAVNTDSGEKLST